MSYLRKLALSLSAALPLFAHATLPQTVSVETGALQGVATSDGAVVSFKGVPFAAAPVGELRLKPPAPPVKWQGVRQADDYGATCPQGATVDHSTSGKSPYTPEFFSHNPQSEDCLFLNIWTPAKTASAKLPVMLYFYGGGFSAGSADEAAYDGEGLARKGVIVITINYRLGLLGFLASPELDQESKHHVSGNYGMLDQIAALQWVKRNIKSFGGNPNLVTIFGQSAGGGSVHFMLISPLAHGLFQRAIVESATMYPQDPLISRGAMFYRTLGDAEDVYAKYLAKNGVTSLAQIKSMTTAQILALPPGPFPPAFFSPVVDGYVFPQSFRDTYAAHKQNNVPVIAGGNAEDLGSVPTLKTTLADYNAWAQKKFGPLTGEFLKLYPAADDNQAGIEQNLAIHDQNLITKSLWAQEFSAGTSQPIYLYYWTHWLPGPYASKFGAFHTSEVPYVMGSLPLMKGRTYTQQDWAFSNMLGQYWANFARTGNPNGSGLPQWASFQSNGLTLEFGDNIKPFLPGGVQAKIDFFKKYFATFKPL